MKKIFLSIFFNLMINILSFSQDNIGEIINFKYENRLIENEISKIISNASIENSLNFKFCTLKFLITYNENGSAGLPNDEISYDIYIVIKDGDLIYQQDKLYVLKNIYDLNTKSLKFKEVNDIIIMTFESTIAKKGKNWEKDLDYDYKKVKNAYTIDFKSIIKNK